ncbi:MAG TPA: aromatic ring-hydroxylating dioxygenase subunit alpha [Burkholderiaceae bacterium]
MAFSIEADITKAATLDTSFYTEEKYFQEARERVFARSWQWLGLADDAARAGSVAPRELLPGLLSEPLMLARDEQGELRCLSNVCTHRGNILVHQACQLKQIRCGYHARRFDLTGKMLSMPEFAEAQNFPSEADNLPSVPFATWRKHGFASIAPAAALSDFMAEIETRLSWLPIGDFVHDPGRDRDFDLDAHWALYVENYLEGFHIPFVHAGLNAVVEYGSYASEIGRYANLQLAIAREGEPAFDIPAGATDHGKRVAAYYWWVFPNLMLNFYPWGLSLNLIQPQSRERTRISFRSFVWNVEKLDKGAGSGLDTVEMEDEEIVRAVQRGVRSRFYRHGRYSPTRERGVHHFHRLLCEFMA